VQFSQTKKTSLAKKNLIVLGLQRASIIATKHIRQSASRPAILSRVTGEQVASNKSAKKYITLDEICEAHLRASLSDGLVTGWMNLAIQHVPCCCCYSSIEPTMFCVQNMTH